MDNETTIQEPKGYSPLTNDQRTQWNSFLDYTGKQGVNLDNSGSTALNQYKKVDPNFSITPDQISHIQYEQHQIRNGETFGSLNAPQLNYIRKGLSPDYLNKPVSVDGKLNNATAKLYYPKTAKTGTDIEGYANSLMGVVPTTEKPVSPADSVSSIPEKANPLPISGPTMSPTATPEGATPLPDFSNAKSRLQYVGALLKKHGAFMQGRGDTPLNVNEVPRGAKDTAKNISTKIGGEYGIDPALLYSSAMEEGLSGLFKSKASGLDTKNRKAGDFGYQDYFGDKDFPVNGNQSLGVPDFTKRFPELVKGGYLPKEFASRFRGKDGEFSGNDFKSVEDGLKAKAALVKYNMDDISKYAKGKGIELSDKAKEFFALVGYNGGEGTSHKMISDYSRNGLLKDDKFIEKRPTSGDGLKEDSYKTVHENISRRMKMREALKKEGLFD